MEVMVKMDIKIIIYRFKKYIGYYLVLICKKHGIIVDFKILIKGCLIV